MIPPDYLAYLRKKLAELQAQLAVLLSKKTSSDRLTKFCLAIQEHEGWYPGSHSYRNNNPGNIKYLGQPEATGKDKSGFAIFPTYDAGFNYLKRMVANAASGKSQQYSSMMSILLYFKKYAPSEDNNDPTAYAKAVAARCGLSINDPIKRLLE